jgi:hypothetical protein
MRPLRAALVATITGIGCSGGSAPTPVPVAGAWTFTQVVDGGGTSCGEGGTLNLTERGNTVDGTFASRGGCSTPSGALDYRRDGAVEEAGISAMRLRLRLGVCRYEGAITEDPPRTVRGQVTCAGLPGVAGTLAGTWEMRR